MTRKLDWLGDDGPLVLLAEEQATRWLGVWRDAAHDDEDVEVVNGRRLAIDDTFDEDSPATDYARACVRLEAPAAAALVPFEDGVGVVLETTGHQAALVPSAGGAIVAKWIAAPSEQAAERALAAIPDSLVWSHTGVVWDVPSPGVRLHVAADRFEDGGLALPLAPGRYGVETAAFAPDAETSFELFRLRPL